jgi:hypothetical protein
MATAELMFRATNARVPQDNVYARFSGGPWELIGYLAWQPEDAPFCAILDALELAPQDFRLFMEILFDVKGKRRVCLPKKPPRGFYRGQPLTGPPRADDSQSARPLWVPLDFNR